MGAGNLAHGAQPTRRAAAAPKAVVSAGLARRTGTGAGLRWPVVCGTQFAVDLGRDQGRGEACAFVRLIMMASDSSNTCGTLSEEALVAARGARTGPEQGLRLFVASCTRLSRLAARAASRAWRPVACAAVRRAPGRRGRRARRSRWWGRAGRRRWTAGPAAGHAGLIAGLPRAWVPTGAHTPPPHPAVRGERAEVVRPPRA
jgi:hypothetical protein